MVLSERQITLEKKINDTLSEHKDYHQSVVTRKVMGVFDEFAKELGRAAWIDGYEYRVKNSIRYLEFLELHGFIFKHHKEIFPKFTYEKVGIDLNSAITVDSSKLIQHYPSPYDTDLVVTTYFNNSLIRFNGRYIMSYRMDLCPYSKYTRLGICELDDDFQVIKNSNKLLDLESKMNGYGAEDGRLFIFDGKLFITYSTNYNGNNFQIAIAEIKDDFSINKLLFLQKPFPDIPEKNWLFFEYKKELYCIYHADCMSIYKMDGDHFSDEAYISNPANWQWGEIRGGASPVLHDDKFFHFFHSTKYHIDRSTGRKARQFYMGLQVFGNEAPFNILAMSREPILTRSELDESMDSPSLPHAIIYPCGAIRNKENDGWIISFGDSDVVCKLINIPDTYIDQNLV